MKIKDLMSEDNLKKIKKEMSEASGGYQVYNPFTLPVKAEEGTLVFKKIKDYDLLPGEFKGKSVSDIGCCLGFFSFYSLYLGAEKVIGYDKDPTYLSYCNTYSENYGKIYPEFKNKIQFKDLDITSLPSLEKTDIVMVNSILHWIFIIDRQAEIKNVLKWLFDSCNESVYFEGCIDASDPSMVKYNVDPAIYNSDLFISEAKKIFKRVDVVKKMSYSSTRVQAKFHKF